MPRNTHAALAKVQQGVEIVIEQDNRPVAMVKQPKPVGRMISEIVADLKARGSNAVMDDDFARDIEEGIKAQRQPWTPPSWEECSTPACSSPPSDAN
ncbi:MAG: hypothetical protein IPM24_16555 [Bryobacterales bacterium]|nr:hypothetical protein [Bryobacterales bacterium]